MPRLSVVIPIYNAEPYLEECLDSISRQGFSDMEVVLVDDGSEDGSEQIARTCVAREPRFRLVRHPENRGPGAARNTGAAHTDPDSEYIAFADSDDLIPPNAYGMLTASLDASGSDFAAGNVYRFDSSRFFPFEKCDPAFRETRIGTHIAETPSLARDRTIWNKVYRRSFWARQAPSFPEGMLYEDSPVTVPLYYTAKAVDVLSDTVYHWRIREAGEPSITQRRTVSAMVDRFASIDMVRAFLIDHGATQGSPAHLTSYDRNILEEELPLFFDELIDADDRHRREFTKRAGLLLAGIDSSLVVELPRSLQDIYQVIREGRTDELVASLQATA